MAKLESPANLALRLLLACAICSTLGCSGGTPSPKAEATKTKVAESQDFPLFTEITAASGIDFMYRNGEEAADHYSILESLGGGVGLIDFDGDGLLDVFLPGGGTYLGADKKNIVGYPVKFFRNLGQGKFQDVTTASGFGTLANGKPWFYSHGVAVADYDRDGWPDLLVTGWGAVALFHNVPVDPSDAKKGRRFEDLTEKAGLHRGFTWTTSAGFGDLDGDGFPDLYVCQYVDWSWEKNPKCSYDGKIPDVCPPRDFDGLPHKVFRNSGDGAFVEVSATVGLVAPGPNSSKGLGVLFVDVDGDSRPDLYVANDTVDNFLYLNRSKPGKIVLEERALVTGVARDDRGAANGSMGLDAGDPERLGKPYLWVTNYENELHGLYRNECQNGRVFFNFHTASAGIAVIGQRYVGWGTGFLDADLTGWEDLVVANGHAIRSPMGDPSQRKMPPVLLRNTGGKFRNGTTQLGEYGLKSHTGRGVAIGDLDNDGRLDLVISHVNEPVSVLRGIGGQNKHWLGIQLVGKENACVVGAKGVLEIGQQKITRFLKDGGSYLSAGDRRMHFGLGEATQGRLTIHWPDGTQQQFDQLPVDRYHRIQQGNAVPLPQAGL